MCEQGVTTACGKPEALRPTCVAQAAAPTLASRGFPSTKDKTPNLVPAGSRILLPESAPATPGPQANPLSLNFPTCKVGQ